MSDNALSVNSGFIDRSRFRSSFDEPTYIKRKIETIKPRLEDINSPGYRPRKLKIDRVRIKSARLALKDVTQMSVVPQGPVLAETMIKRHKVDRRFAGVYSRLKPANKLQLVRAIVAVLMIITGAYISLISLQNNQAVHAQAVKLTSEANKTFSTTPATNPAPSSNNAISTVKPTAKTYSAYTVAPGYPKYLKIPIIGVNSIVGQTGLLASGALGTPSNVYYTDWYTGSAEPGQPGATLIDGHVSSWTSKGVFFNLHLLKAGDMIQVVKGDNSIVNYQVVQTSVYSSNDVDMQAAMKPIVAGVSGLNLITCTGQVIKGTSEFNERIIVFAKEV